MSLRSSAESAASKVVVADRIDESASTLAALRDHGVEAIKVLVDLGTFSGARDLISRTQASYGRIHVLVINVGGTIWIKPYHLYTEEEVELEIHRSLFRSSGVASRCCR